MDRVWFNYSMKTIPLPTCNSYKKRLIGKVESVIKRMRWKAYFYLNDDQNENFNRDTKWTFRLQSKKCPPQVNELKAFEEDLIRMTENIQYRKVNNSFLSSLRSDAAKINASDKVYVFADKTRNLYKLDKASYEKLLNENITAKYKRAKDDTMDVITNDLFKIADKLDVSDRIDTMTVKQAFITLKDHKDSFAAKPSCRLINPAKSEMGKVSKVILDTINTKIRSISKVNQWRNTMSVIDWFKHIPDKDRCTFVVFDIVDFYPSISPLTSC
ncbi:hypothetical protein HOLleu_06301 [Holothuria leucospilota]|uniref:Uncharacterized protein n=1 Tax=Holothuria leucospilota TaxID=206669 RepID=A0A9Q1HJG9_HOLLE|nr:hypothetical protein HOLleu_06301 [Holothuria leucospilota]